MMPKHHLEYYLSKYFQHTTFRTGQKEIIQDVLKKRDILGVLPTGSGKSLCYQLPARILPGTTIVVSPLISLMMDQVRHLKANQFKAVVALNSFLTVQERTKVYENLSNYKLIFVSPELLQQQLLIEALKKIHINLFVIDEAHCISQWGHEFRPDYLRLTKIINELQSPPILALTATATKNVQSDIINILKRPNMKKHIYPIDRPNIALIVKKGFESRGKLEKLLHILSTYRVPTIIYFSSRMMTEKVTQIINERLPELRVSYYHGGMETVDRITVQQQFINDQLDVICCTSAFGMGIDKQNIRLVIHYHFPAELESYIQEIGRAGRDGKQSVALTLFSEDDLFVQQNIINNEFPNEQTLKEVYQLLAHPLTNNKEEIEQNILEIVDQNEIHFCFLQYQLEKHGIINNKSIVKHAKNLQISFQKIQQHITTRYQLKSNKLFSMVKWMNSDQCYRERLYKSFQKSFIKPTYCCNNCGFELTNWHPEKTYRSQIQHRNWQQKLNHLFFLGETNET